MIERDFFVGRKEELKRIEDVILRSDSKSHILPIIGRGGSGKTWLLRHVKNKYESNPHLAILNIDYSEARFQSVPSLTLALIEQLQKIDTISKTLNLPDKINRYRELFHEWEQTGQLQSEMSMIIDAASPFSKHELQIYQYGLSILQAVSGARRIVILSDTIDAVPVLEFGVQINYLAAQLNNTTILIAGRPIAFNNEMQRFDAFHNKDYWTIHKPIGLDRFSEKEARTYFREALSIPLEDKLISKIIKLTDSNPVLIGISAEWIQRNIVLPDEIQVELDSLSPKELANTQTRFEYELIGKIRELDEPVDWAILYLSYLNRRFDPEILKLVLSIESDDELDDLMEKLAEIIFVRKSLVSENGLLHDEAQRLINKHAWHSIDPTRHLRDAICRKVVEAYYLPRISSLANQISKKNQVWARQLFEAPDAARRPLLSDDEVALSTLQVEVLDYTFRVDETQGWQYLSTLLSQAINQSSLITLDAIQQAVINLKLEQKHVSLALLARARINQGKRMYEEAELFAQKALYSGLDDPDDVAIAHRVLAECEPVILRKLVHYDAGFQQAAQTTDQLIDAEIHNDRGLALRRVGRWADSLNEYKQALKIFQETGKETEAAAVKNNMAFVYLLMGETERADILAHKALHQRAELGNAHALALSYSTLGRIFVEQRDDSRARMCFRTAEELASSQGDYDFAALCRVNVADIEITSHDFDSARSLLADGLKSKSPEIQIRAFHQAAKADFTEGKRFARAGAKEDAFRLFSNAYNNALTALEKAHITGNTSLYCAVLYDIALIYHLWHGTEHTDAIARLKSELSMNDFKVERGRLEELLGDIQFSKGNRIEAFHHYTKACEVLASFSPGAFQHTYERVRSKYLGCDSEEQSQISDIIQNWFAPNMTRDYLLERLVLMSQLDETFE